VLYKSMYKPISDLPNEDKGMLLDAIFMYQINGEIKQDLSTQAMMAFKFFQAQFDSDNIRYERKCNKNKEIAEKRWKKAHEKNANECERIQTHTNYADIDKDIDIDIELDKDIDKDIIINNNNNNNNYADSIEFPNVDFTKDFKRKKISDIANAIFDKNSLKVKPEYESWADSFMIKHSIQKKNEGFYNWQIFIMYLLLDFNDHLRSIGTTEYTRKEYLQHLNNWVGKLNLETKRNETIEKWKIEILKPRQTS